MNNFEFYDLQKLIIKIVQEHDEGDQIRKHHKKRINKKWLKRYGVYTKQKLGKDQVVIMDGIAYMSRPKFRELKHILNLKEKKDVGD